MEEDLEDEDFEEYTPGVSPFEIFEGPKLDAMTSMLVLRDRGEAERVLREHPEYRNLRSVWHAIDEHAAAELEARIVEDERRARDALLAEVRAAPKHPGIRKDTEVLRAQVKRRRPSRRVEQVYRMCIEEGLSLNQCAKALRIGRETVRSHLRKLRSEVPAAWRVPRTA